MTGSEGPKPPSSSTEMTLRSDLSTPWKSPEAEVPKKAPAKIPSALPAEGIPGFDLGRVLGKGGMGLVVAGTRRSDGQVVAIKLLRADMTSDAEFRERFHREVEVMKEVRHQNVVGIVDSGEFQGWLWLALELMPDGDLERYLRPRGQLFEKDALNFAIKVARGLAAVHAAGLLHRDIKPQNIFLNHKAGNDGDVKVGDLGMARHASGDDRMTMTGTACGTPAYMAPEQIRGLADLDARVDVYALGVLLYTLLAGKEPFIGDTVYTITHAVLNDPVPDLRRSNPNVSAVVVGIIRKAMAKDRKNRYATMNDMQRDLEAVAQGARPLHVGVVDDQPAIATARATPAGRAPAASISGGGMGGGFSLPGFGLAVRVCLVLAVIIVPLTLLPKLLERRVSGIGDGNPGGPRVAPGHDSQGTFCTIQAAGHAFTLRWCPPGTFTMGSPAGENARAPWENAHRVHFTAGCWMLESEVDQAQYQGLTGANPSTHIGPTLPVDNVTLAESENFLAKLNALIPGLNARLPSEAEWEYACRAGHGDAFSSPPDAEALLTDRDMLAAWDKQPLDAPPNWDALLSAFRGLPAEARPEPRVVSNGQPNPWGIADLHGNVQEWCRDRWDYRTAYPSTEVVDPVANAGVLAVVRGGSWIHPATRARSASRHAQDPDIGTAWVGFRFVVPGAVTPEPLPTSK